LCALCKVVRDTTNNCPELPHLKPFIHETFPKSNILGVHVNILGKSKKLITLHANHPSDLCNHHGHYSHCFPHLNEFCNYLEELREYELTHSGAHTPISMDYGTTSKRE